MDDANLSLTEEDVISIVKKISIRKTEYFATTSILLEIVKTLFFRNSYITKLVADKRQISSLQSGGVVLLH